MTIFDDVIGGIVDAFTQSGDNWLERRGESIISLTSPESGRVFDAVWVSSERGADKKVGLFSYPNIKGTVAQDLKANSDLYSTVFQFEGDNCDLYARDFFAIATRETGLWSAIDPLYGQIPGLQLLSIREAQNNREGGIVVLETEWIEPIDSYTLQTQRELFGLVDGQCSVVQLNSIEQFVETCDQTSKTLRKTIEDTVSGIENVVEFVLSPLQASVDLVDSAMTSVQRGIQGSLNAVLLPLAELAGQVQDLCNLPLLAANDTKARYNHYNRLMTELSALLPGNQSAIAKTWDSARTRRNSIATVELALVSGIVAQAQIALTATDLDTRAQAISLASDIVSSFDTLIGELDSQQGALDDKVIEDQYFASSAIYNDLVKLVFLTVEFLLQKAWELKIERRFTLDHPRCPLEICISEYQDAEQFDLFISINKLEGNEILMLPAGREVIVSV